MKVLWITNIQFPATCQKLGIPTPVVGGWMSSSAINLVKNDDVELVVATVYVGTNLQRYDIDKICYYLLPKNRINTLYDNTLEKYWLQIKDQFNPDIIRV